MMSALPFHLAQLRSDQLIDLDVRDDLRNGREPFSRIMAARAQLRPGDVLRLTAIFEPVPLYRVLGRFGYDYWSEELPDGDWRVWFFTTAESSTPAATIVEDTMQPAVSAAACAGEDVTLDVRGLEPPLPLMRTLEALEQLSPAQRLVQLNERVPQFLLPQLNARGFAHATTTRDDGVVETVIWKP